MSCERVYATTGDFGIYAGSRAPDTLDRRLLVRASRRVDRALHGVRYPVDEHGMPRHPTACTDHDHAVRCPVVALREATCAQVQWCLERGDLTGAGVPEQWDNVKVGDVALSRKAEGTAGPDGRLALAPAAGEVLEQAGLLELDVWLSG